MNTPSAEMLKEAARHMKRQTNYEKWELLSQLREGPGFTVDFQELRFTCASLCMDDFCDSDDDNKPMALPLDAIFGILIRDGFLYILCKNGVLYMLGIETGLWSLRFPVMRPSLVMRLSWRCSCWAEKVRGRLRGKSK